MEQMEDVLGEFFTASYKEKFQVSRRIRNPDWKEVVGPGKKVYLFPPYWYFLHFFSASI